MLYRTREGGNNYNTFTGTGTGLGTFLSFFFFFLFLSFFPFFRIFFFLIHSIHTLRAYYTPCALFTFISLSNQGVCNGRGDSVGEERETFVCLAG